MHTLVHKLHKDLHKGTCTNTPPGYIPGVVCASIANLCVHLCVCNSALQTFEHGGEHPAALSVIAFVPDLGHDGGKMTYREAMHRAAVQYWKSLLAAHNVVQSTRVSGVSRSNTYTVLKRLGLCAGSLRGRRG